VRNCLGVACWVVGLQSIAACAPREREVVAHGFRYVTREDDPVAPEVLAELGRHRRAIEGYLQLDSISVGEISYRKYRDQRDLDTRSHCSPASSACYFRTWGVETPLEFDKHELVHAYTAVWGDAHRLLEEGLAEALSCQKYLPQKVNFDAEFAFSEAAWWSEATSEVRVLYGAGARFVAHLMRNFGRQRFAAFYSRTRPGQSFNEVQVTFRDVYGAELTQVWNDANDAVRADAGCLFAFECSEPILTTFEPSHSKSHGTLDVTSETLLHFTRGSDDRSWRLMACDHVPLPYEGERLRATGEIRGHEHWLALSPGRYWVDHSGSHLERLPLSAHVVSPQQCPTAVPLELRRADQFFALSDDSVPERSVADSDVGSALTRVIKLQVGSFAPRAGSLECSDTARVELCTACDYIQCQVACGSNSPRFLSVANGAVLKVTSAPAANVWFRLRFGER
jgi:hypothetical protein